MGRKHGARNRNQDRPAGFCSNNGRCFPGSGRKTRNYGHPWNNEPAKGNLEIVRAWIKNERYRATVHAVRIDGSNRVRLYVNGKRHKDFNLHSGWEGRIIRVIVKAANKRV
jgi:hypothetical protein